MGRSIPGEGTHKDPRVGSVWTGVCFPMCDVSSATPCRRAVRLSEGDRGRGYGWGGEHEPAGAGGAVGQVTRYLILSETRGNQWTD